MFIRSNVARKVFFCHLHPSLNVCTFESTCAAKHSTRFVCRRVIVRDSAVFLLPKAANKHFTRIFLSFSRRFVVGMKRRQLLSHFSSSHSPPSPNIESVSLSCNLFSCFARSRSAQSLQSVQVLWARNEWLSDGNVRITLTLTNPEKKLTETHKLRVSAFRPPFVRGEREAKANSRTDFSFTQFHSILPKRDDSNYQFSFCLFIVCSSSDETCMRKALEAFLLLSLTRHNVNSTHTSWPWPWHVEEAVKIIN